MILEIQRSMEKSSYLLLFLAVSIIIGYTYSLDTPEALEIPLRNAPYNFTTAYFNLMYFFTFLSVAIFCIPIGLLIDRLSLSFTIISLLILSLLSQFLTGLMFQLQPTPYILVIMIMRAVFGAAGEGLFSAQCSIISIYGKKDYQMLMGFGLSAPFIFDAINAVVTPAVYNKTENLPLAWYIGSGVCLYSLLTGLYLSKKILGFPPQEYREKNDEIFEQERDENINTSDTFNSEKKNCLKELKEMGSGFWVIIAAIFFFEASLGPVNDNFNELLVRRFNISYTDAGKLLLIHFTLLPFISALFSYALGKVPHLRRLSIVVSSILYFLAHLSVYFLGNTSSPKFYHYLVIAIFLIILSVNFSIYYVSLTAAVTYMIEEKVLGTAWGIAGSVVGFSQCIVPLIFIEIIDSNPDLSISYRSLSLFCCSLSVIPVLFGLWIYFRDYRIIDNKLLVSQALENEKKEIVNPLVSESNQQKLI